MIDLSRFFTQYKKAIIAVLVGLVFLLGAFSAGYMLGLRNASTESETGNYISNNGTRAAQVRRDIHSALTEQREITERIDRLQDGAGQVTGSLEKGATGVDKAAIANLRAEILVSESGELIAEGQRIIQSIRSRGQTGTSTH